MKLVMYGAGSIGRGFIGPLFSKAGYEVVFIDINETLVRLLNDQKGYHLRIMADPPYDQRVSNVRAIHGADEERVAGEIASCDLCAVSVGAAVLPQVAPLIAKGLARRRQQDNPALNILLCENLKGAASHMRSLIAQALPNVLSSCGLVETAVGRMVPAAPVDSPESLSLAAEAYGYLPVDQAAFVGAIPDVPGLLLYSPFSFYEERKLYLHNMGHSFCAYLGLLAGYRTIVEAIEDPYIFLFVKSAMTESASMLSAKYGKPFEEVFRHAEDLLLRFGNRALMDTCERVARDPLRKLQAEDRFAGPLRACWGAGVHAVYIASALAAALFSLTRDPFEARMIVEENCALSTELSDIVATLFAAYGQSGLAALFSTIQRIKGKTGGSRP